MKEVIKNSIANVPKVHGSPHKGYEYYRRNLIKSGDADKIQVTQYELLPGKSSYPYHYHIKSEEFYLILSGEGIVRTPKGEIKVSGGDYIFFPANENGAHKITNTSKTENLVFIDFDTHHELEVAVYPDSEKIGIWGRVNKMYKAKDTVDYYEGE